MLKIYSIDDEATVVNALNGFIGLWCVVELEIDDLHAVTNHTVTLYHNI